MTVTVTQSSYGGVFPHPQEIKCGNVNGLSDIVNAVDTLERSDHKISR